MVSLDNLMDKVMILTYFLCWISILARTEFASRTPLFCRYRQRNASCDTEYYRSLDQKKTPDLIEVIFNRYNVQYLNKRKKSSLQLLHVVPTHMRTEKHKKSLFVRWMHFKRSSEGVSIKKTKYKCTCFCQICKRFAFRNRDNLSFLISEFFFEEIKRWNSIDVYIK